MCPDLSKQKTALVKAHLRNHLGKRLSFNSFCLCFSPLCTCRTCNILKFVLGIMVSWYVCYFYPGCIICCSKMQQNKVTGLNLECAFKFLHSNGFTLSMHVGIINSVIPKAFLCFIDPASSLLR